jgi:hypothetical protein
MHLIEHKILWLLGELGPLTRERLEKELGSPLDVHPGQLRRLGLIRGDGSEQHPYALEDAQP